MKGIRGMYSLIWNHKIVIFEPHCRPSLEDCEKNTKYLILTLMSDALELGTLFLVLVYAEIFQGFKLNY